MFSGTLFTCGLKTQDEMLKKGTNRNSASLSPEVQHVQEKKGEPQAWRKYKEGGK